ncbi:hypothetical protein FSP39_012685 [Pinctada imbricata]|uniref:C3H1-type domain-containing protein n=1 Tax=Pinctada imbricata TaxID=66713 RepID=A0AA88YQD6_PINIB|nr:hypothetical protein FSP39_012685 [Pinctada imbricata]
MPPRRSSRPPKPKRTLEREEPTQNKSMRTEAAVPELHNNASSSRRDASLQEEIKKCIREEMSSVVRSVVQEMRQEPSATITQAEASSEGSDSTPNERAASAIIQERIITSGPTAGKPAQSIAKPLEVGIDAKIKSKIWSNEFIKLESLMVTKDKQHNPLKLVEQDGAISFVRSKSSNYKFFNISQWNTAFHKFVAIYCTKYPDECSKLMKYAVTISTLASQASLPAALGYDRTFREWRESDPDSLPWDQINTELYQVALGSALEQKAIKHNLQSASTSNFRPYSNQSTTNSAYCYQFNNKGKCSRKFCQFAHICQFCRGQHHKGLCHLRNQASNPSTSTQNSGTTSFPKPQSSTQSQRKTTEHKV